MSTLTSANAVITLAIAGLYPVPQQLQGFDTDDIFDSADVTPSVVKMGADGKMSIGWKPYMTETTFMIQADSDSLKMFLNWNSAQLVQREVLLASGVIVLRSIDQKFILNRGALTKAKVMPAAKDILQPVPFTITWESVLPANI